MKWNVKSPVAVISPFTIPELLFIASCAEREHVQYIHTDTHVCMCTYTHTCTNNIKNQDKLRQNRPIAGFKGTQKPVKIARSSRLIKPFPNRRGTLQKRGDSEKDLSPLDFKWKCGQDWRTSRIQVEKCKSIKKKWKKQL